jgi:hypothetical protein
VAARITRAAAIPVCDIRGDLMADQREFDPYKPVPGIIKELLLTTLPAELRAAAPELVDRVAAHPDVQPHVGRRGAKCPKATARSSRG